MRFDAVLFDCDGTLVDSERLGKEVMYEAAVEHGFSMPFDAFHDAFRGRHFAACQAAIEAAIGRALPDTFVPDIRARQAAYFDEHLTPIDGIPDVLDAVTAAALPRCVASGAPLFKIELLLDLTTLRHHFDDRLYSSYALDMWKPDPDLFLHAAAALGVAPGRCAVIEDSLVGVEAGVAAGMQVFHYTPTDGIATLDHPQVTHIAHMSELHGLLGLT